jgi:uncharacterized protein YkwD
MIDRINEIRAAHGLPSLSENAMLTQAAHDHAADLSRNEWLIEQRRWHDGSDGSTIGERLTRAGYRAARWLENVGWGFGGDERMMFDWWMQSPVHRAAILSADVTEAGAVKLHAPGSDWGYYWAVEFARPVAAPVKQPCPCCGRV